MATPASSGLMKGMGRWGWLSFGAIFKFLKRHWYLTIFFIIVFPAIYGSIQTAIETQNPIHPFLQLGKRIIAADIEVGEDVKILEEQGVEAFIGIPKPTEGIWASVKYKFLFFWKVIFRLFGNVYLIFVPLILIYKLMKFRNISEINKNIMLSVIFFLAYLFIVNAVFVSYGIATGQLDIMIPEEISEFQGMWSLFKLFIPLNGLISLVQYLIGLAVV